MPLPSFSETFDKPCKVLARVSAKYKDEVSSTTETFPSNCSCCWATENSNSRPLSPMWKASTSWTMYENTGYISEFPQTQIRNDLPEQHQCFEDGRQPFSEISENGHATGSIEKWNLFTGQDFFSGCNKQPNLADVRGCSSDAKDYLFKGNEGILKHHDEISGRFLCCDQISFGCSMCNEIETNVQANIANCGRIVEELLPYILNPVDEIMDLNGLPNNPDNEDSENVVTSIQEVSRRDIAETDSLNHCTNHDLDSSCKKIIDSEINSEIFEQENRKETGLSDSISSEKYRNVTPRKAIQNCKDLLHSKSKKRNRKTKKKLNSVSISNLPLRDSYGFICNKCKRNYKHKESLRRHERNHPDCKPIVCLITKKKSFSKQINHSITSKSCKLYKRLVSITTDSDNHSEDKVQECKPKKLSYKGRVFNNSRKKVKNNQGFQLLTTANEILTRGSNSCKESRKPLKIKENLEDVDSKHKLWQCNLCVKYYQHKQSLQRHKTQSHFRK